MKIDDALVQKIAGLSKLHFEGQALETIKGDLDRMIDFVSKLNELNTDATAPLLHMGSGHNVLRPDEVDNMVPQNEALKNGPDTDSDYFKVPKVLKK